jgi:hypothetical protein
MTEDQLVELGFEKILVPMEESGNDEEYYFYNYKLNNDINLVSTDSTESGKRNWKVSIDYWGEIDNVEDVSSIIDLFKRIEK